MAIGPNGNKDQGPVRKEGRQLAGSPIFVLPMTREEHLSDHKGDVYHAIQVPFMFLVTGARTGYLLPVFLTPELSPRIPHLSMH